MKCRQTNRRKGRVDAKLGDGGVVRNGHAANDEGRAARDRRSDAGVAIAVSMAPTHHPPAGKVCPVGFAKECRTAQTDRGEGDAYIAAGHGSPGAIVRFQYPDIVQAGAVARRSAFRANIGAGGQRGIDSLSQRLFGRGGAIIPVAKFLETPGSVL